MGQSAAAEMAIAEPLFESAHGALVFAFNFSGQAYDRPMMNRIAAPGIGSGKGLVGLDGAAQAGFIRAEVRALGKLGEAILFARIAPRTMPCHCRSACCSGLKPNKEWTDAIAYLADHVRTTALAGCTANGVLRREYVVRYFTRKEERVTIDALAKEFGIDRHTVGAHAAKVMRLFGGAQQKRGVMVEPGLESSAFDAIEERLAAAGMIG